MPDKIPIIIATIRSWNIDNFEKWQSPKNFSKHLISKKENLTYENLLKINPKYIFFPHWSWIIPKEVYENFECVVFHMTDLPFGRGGTPLQNLLLQGIYKTKISAIRVTGELDAGPVYLKYPLDIGHGSAQEIYIRASKIIAEMISYILTENPKPKPQKGKIVVFRRRKPNESIIPKKLFGRRLYDFIRMLDAEGYPKAFFEHGKLKFEFTNAKLINDTVTAEVAITRKYGNPKKQ